MPGHSPGRVDVPCAHMHAPTNVQSKQHRCPHVASFVLVLNKLLCLHGRLRLPPHPTPPPTPHPPHRILDIRELVLGPAHRDTAASLCDLAGLLASLDRAMDAEPLLRR